MENNKNKKSVKFQGDMLNFCDFIQVFVFTRNHHLKIVIIANKRAYHSDAINVPVLSLHGDKRMNIALFF